MEIPSKYATVDASWGEGKKHLCCMDTTSFEFHATLSDAREAAEEAIRDGAKMVAVLRVETLLVAKPVEFNEVR